MSRTPPHDIPAQVAPAGDGDQPRPPAGPPPMPGAPPPLSPPPPPLGSGPSGPSGPSVASPGPDESGLASRLQRLGPRSLTGRLIIGVVSLVVVLVAVFAGGTSFALQSFLSSRLDQQVGAAATQNTAFFGHCYVETGFRPGSSCMANSAPSAQTEWVAVISPQGQQVGFIPRTGNLVELPLSPAMAADIAQDPTRLRTIEDGNTELRVQGQVFGDSGIVVVTGLSTAEMHRTVGRLALLEVLLGGVAVVLAAAATAWGVRLSLRGLRRVTATAQEVAAELSPTGRGLDRRVPAVDDSTEVGHLAGSMNTLLAAVETQFAARLESEARLRQFLADASHELRTPLTSIRGYAELARMQRAAGSDADDNLSRIESEGTRMSRLVEDLLTLARSDRDEQTPMRHELVDVAEIVDDVAAGARAAHPQRRIDVWAQPDTHVVGDPDQLLRVVRNLVTNAAVHTAPERPIGIDARAEGPEVVIRVADGGPGLPPEQAAHVFERFWRADKARSRARGGSGLGLAIVASIVHAHGGTVRFDSSVETGSTVTVRLPRADA